MIQQDACCIHMITLWCHVKRGQPVLQQDYLVTPDVCREI
jgi:hypothetical protein